LASASIGLRLPFGFYLSAIETHCGIVAQWGRKSMRPWRQGKLGNRSIAVRW
jgi:hypothetical protein